MPEGVVEWFNSANGFGFIEQNDGPDVFVQCSAIQSEDYKSLEEGDKIKFEIVDDNKGPSTENVTHL